MRGSQVPEPALDAGERAMLEGFLDHFRDEVLRRVEGLSDEQARRASCPPSTLTAIGVVKHLALDEDGWFTEVMTRSPLPEPWRSAPFDDDPDWEFHSAREERLADVVGLYEVACERSRVAIASFPDLQGSGYLPRIGESFSLRWVLIHMLEETAAHCGHLDLLRQAIDGATAT